MTEVANDLVHESVKWLKAYFLLYDPATACSSLKLWLTHVENLYV